MNNVRLRQAIMEGFNLEELKTLCFDLGIDFESLGGGGKEGKVRELVASLERRGETPNLIAACYNRRPDSFWQNALPEGATTRLLMSTVGRLESRMYRMECEIDRLRTVATATLTAVILLIGAAGIVMITGG